MVNTFEMKFENEGYKEMVAAKEARKDASMPIRAATLFEMFPFCLLFNVSTIKHHESFLIPFSNNVFR